MIMVEAKNICKSFGAHKVLDSIDLEIKKGEVVVVIGPSGSGKSTLLRCLNGLDEIDSGTVLIEGEIFSCRENNRKDSVSLKQKKRIAIKLGMVFQHFNLFPHRTVIENITEAPVTVLGMNKKSAEKMAEVLLEKVGLAEKRNYYPSRISGGQKQRVAIARALGMNPDIILFDEPTSSLDPELVGEVQRVITELAREKMTMLIVTHEMRFASDVADRIIFMDDGRVIADAKPVDIFSNPEHPRIRAFLEKVAINNL